MTKHIDLIFDGPPGPQGPRFIEAEDDTGRSICAGEWLQHVSGQWAFRIKPESFDALAT